MTFLHIEGAIATLAALFPNLLLMFFPPTEIPTVPQSEPWLLVGFERIGQVGYTLLPTLVGIDFTGSLGEIALMGMFISLGSYYCGWLRFFKNGRVYSLLFTPLWGIPIPMALSPVLYFAFIALAMRSGYMGLLVVLLAAGHIPISYRTFTTCCKDKS